MSNKYIFWFWVKTETGKKQIRWERMGSDMYSAFDLAIDAAKKDYSNASGFSMFAA